jgi:hypothetical protein
MDDLTRMELESATFRRLVSHLRKRTDAQNIDLMGLAGFCRNCLADWYLEAAEKKGVALSKEASREAIYGMSYDQFKQKHQRPASEEQLRRMAESVARNKLS